MCVCVLHNQILCTKCKDISQKGPKVRYVAGVTGTQNVYQYNIVRLCGGTAVSLICQALWWYCRQSDMSGFVVVLLSV